MLGNSFPFNQPIREDLLANLTENTEIQFCRETGQ